MGISFAIKLQTKRKVNRYPKKVYMFSQDLDPKLCSRQRPALNVAFAVPLDIAPQTNSVRKYIQNPLPNYGRSIAIYSLNTIDSMLLLNLGLRRDTVTISTNTGMCIAIGTWFGRVAIDHLAVLWNTVAVARLNVAI